MNNLKRYLAAMAAVLLCLGILSGCSARNSSDNKMILDGHKFPIGQCSVKELTG